VWVAGGCNRPAVGGQHQAAHPCREAGGDNIVLV
jgi:hypothetical protein